MTRNELAAKLYELFQLGGDYDWAIIHGNDFDAIRNQAFTLRDEILDSVFPPAVPATPPAQSVP